MRPLHGDDAFGRQRSADLPLVNHTPNNQMSFIIADEAAVDSFLDQPRISTSRFSEPKKLAPEPACSSSQRREDKDGESSRCATRCPEPLLPRVDSSPGPILSHGQPLSRPMTPITLGTSWAGSVMSTPSSRRNSLAGSLSEHALSSDDEEDHHHPESSAAGMMDSGSAPQLVMPSIRMPSRRPFTEKGRSIGRLKVLIAGKSGVGKTSLVKAIVQSCEHIVHVDPITPQTSVSRRSSQATEIVRSSSRRTSNWTSSAYEILASTKPYPDWWAELDGFRTGQRRKSLGDQVLDRNICFVDTPGYGSGSSVMESIVPCIEYVESHLNRLSSDSLSDTEMLHMLGGDGGFQVDVVLYMIQRSLSPADVEYLKRLAPLANIIPLLGHADKLTKDEQTACKREIAGQLDEAGIRPFSFTSANLLLADDLPSIPYAVSSATEMDHDVMDASLLMSDEYVQPLISTELDVLVNQIFSPNGSSWLRYSAAKKYLQWRNEANQSRPMHLYRPLNVPCPSRRSNAPGVGVGSLVGHQSSSLMLARITEQNASNQTRFQVVDWAADLQRSLVAERIRYETLARNERAVWSTERLTEGVQDGTLIPVSRARHRSSPPRKRVSHSRKKSHHPQDPLGLLLVAADIRAKGWVTLELLGSLGLIGGLAFWLARQRWQVEPVQLVDEWTRLWGMDI
ncbi:hypothetical protein BX600DRAFT_253780 [Xylariales sp. PMI_506]|nr:hypothetical protein BX600DRAFT_253780 [Xylariales sp. PMI_506]